jgi:hypothetical protein
VALRTSPPICSAARTTVSTLESTVLLYAVTVPLEAADDIPEFAAGTAADAGAGVCAGTGAATATGAGCSDVIGPACTCTREQVCVQILNPFRMRPLAHLPLR